MTRRGDDIMHMFVIYKHPLDYPGKWVARKWRVVPGEPEPQAAVAPLVVAQSLEAARVAVLNENPTAAVLPRTPDDDPAVYEVWL